MKTTSGASCSHALCTTGFRFSIILLAQKPFMMPDGAPVGQFGAGLGSPGSSLLLCLLMFVGSSGGWLSTCCAERLRVLA